MKKIKIHIYIYMCTHLNRYVPVKCHFASKEVCALYLYMYIDIYSIFFFSHIRILDIHFKTNMRMLLYFIHHIFHIGIRTWTRLGGFAEGPSV